MIDAVRGRLWRHYADARRVLGRRGGTRVLTPTFGSSRRADHDAWTRTTGDRHEVYRRAVPPIRARVAAVCVTSRPGRLPAVIEGVAAQDHPDIELVVVTNSGAYVDVDVEDVVAGAGASLARALVLRRPEETSLGECLNDAMSMTDARFVAKIDDDDRYGARYISDALRAHRYAGAGVVGKHTYYAYLEPTDETALRFPGHEFSYSSTLAGGTLVIDRDRAGAIRFEDRSLGEDRAFIAACHRAGVSTFSADRFNFTQVRASDNTWTIDREDFLRGADVVGSGWLADEVDR